MNETISSIVEFCLYLTSISEILVRVNQDVAWINASIFSVNTSIRMTERARKTDGQ